MDSLVTRTDMMIIDRTNDTHCYCGTSDKSYCGTSDKNITLICWFDFDLTKDFHELFPCDMSLAVCDCRSARVSSKAKLSDWDHPNSHPRVCHLHWTQSTVSRH